MLNDAILIGLVATVMQLLVKPLLLQVWPQEHGLQDTITRAAVGVVSYAAVLANTAALHPLSFAVAWGLLPQAGAVAGSAIAAYHILTADGGHYPAVETDGRPGPAPFAEGPVRTPDATPAGAGPGPEAPAEQPAPSRA
jgi:hypothetical protein